MEYGKKLSRRQFLRVAGGAAGGVVLAACAPAPPAAVEPSEPEEPEEPAEPTAQPEAEQVTVRWGMYSSPQWTPIFEEMFDEFEAKWPNITVEPEWAPFDQWVQKLQTSIASGTLADVAICDWDEFYDRVKGGTCLPLDDYITGNDVPKENWYEAVIDQFSLDGKMYGLPLGVLSIVTWYHQTALEEAGLPLPNEDTTWAELYDTAQKLTKRDADGNITFWGMSAPTWLTGQAGAKILSAGGTGSVNKEYTKATINEPIAVEQMEWAVALLHDDKIAPRSQDIEGLGDPFQAGKIGIHVNPSWNVYWFRDIEKSDFIYDVTKVPKDGETGDQISPIYFGGFSIYPESEVPDEAWLLINEAVGPREGNVTAQKLMAGYGCHFPTKWATDDDWFLRGVPQRPEHWQTIFTNLNNSVAVPRRCGYREWSGLEGQEFDAAVVGELSVQEALDNAAAAVQEVIDRCTAEEQA